MEDAKAAVGKTLKYTISNGFMLASGSVGFDWLLAFCLLFFPSVSATDISILLCFCLNNC